jgi:uncharacterized repeat protein (TIGR01451 family)
MSRCDPNMLPPDTREETMRSMRPSHRCARLLIVAAVVLVITAVGSTASAQAATGPEWTITMSHSPSALQRGDVVGYTISIQNTGDAPTTGPITLRDDLPAGVQLRTITGVDPLGGTPVCPSAQAVRDGAPLACVSAAGVSMAPGDATELDLTANVSSQAADTVTNVATVSGGGAPAVSSTDPVSVVDRAAFAVNGFSARSLDAAGDDDAIAGDHPYDATTSFSFPRYQAQDAAHPVEDPKDMIIHLPAGFVGNAAAAPRCLLTDLATSFPTCPTASQVGELTLGTAYGNPKFALFNMVPEKGFPAEFAFRFLTNVIVMYPQVSPRSAGYGLTISVPGASRLKIVSIGVQFFGVPSLRNGAGGPAIPFLSNQSDCLLAQPSSKIVADSWQHPGPTLDDGSPDLKDSRWKTAVAPAPPVTGCDNPLLVSQFAPTIKAGPTPGTGSTAADTPSGYQVDLGFPQTNDPTDLSTVFDPSVPAAPQLKDTTVTLPVGTAISPSAADGLDACSDVPGDDQVRLDTVVPVTCPDASKIGSVVGKSPLLASHDPDTDEVTGAEPINGDVYLVKPHPGDLSPSGDQDGKFRVLIQLENERYGLNIKLPGIVTADKSTGRLTARFTNNPQLPVKLLRLVFKGGDRAPLVNSPLCTSNATTTGVFTPWSRGGTRTDGVVVAGTPDATASSSFAVDEGADGGACAFAVKDLPFSPSFSAGVLDPQGGGSSPFVLRLTRKDGEQELGSIDTTLPPGLLANIAAVPRCLEAQAAAGTCDSASQVGTTTVGAGAGSSPLFVPQPGKSPSAVYLAGPYRDAPFSLSIVVPTQAGPFDLGTVVVRAALYVDPVDGHATVKSDPLPTMRDGVPLRARDVRVNIDRPGFMVLPTNCAPMAIGADIRSAVGATFQALEPFQGKNCSVLGLRPRLDLTLSGKGQTIDDKHPAVTANLTQGSGQSNLKKVRVSLPLSLALDPDNANGLCEFVDGSKVEPSCPASSIVGTATARTPILDQPLSGPVYFVKNVRIDAKSGRQIKTLPKLVIPLTGENGVKLTLTGTSNVEDNHLVTTFDNIPDAPVSSFKLDIAGGKHGILVVSGADICAATQVANQGVEGQNLKQANIDIPIKTPSCPVKVITKKIGKTTVAVKVGGLSAGKLTISGTGIKKTSKTIVTSTVATITAHRTKSHLGKVKVSFLPKGTKKAKTTTTR